MKEISVFGEQAMEIQVGQIFIAKSVEIETGHKIILVPVINYDKDSCPSYEVREQ